MWRSFFVTQVALIILSGQDGGLQDPKPGVPSTTPGSNGVAGTVTNLDVRSFGGNGQNGQDVGDSPSFADTPGPNLASSSGNIMPASQCVSSVGGYIQMKLYPNDCKGEASGCYAGEEGVYFYVCGKGPESPGNGGSGGNPGMGGEGGFKVVVNVTNSIPSIQHFTRGINGMSGNGGARGGQGTWGAIRVKVDDVVDSGERRCKVMDGPYTGKVCFQPIDALPNNATYAPDRAYFPSNMRVIDLNNSELESKQAATASYSLEEFREYLELLVANARSNFNIFNKKEMSAFIDFVESNTYLWE